MTPELRHLAGTTGTVRTEMHLGREHLVVPVVALVPGVIHAVNAPTAEMVPLETLSEKPERWNERPVVFGHPKGADGRQCSANNPAILEAHGFGHVSNARVENSRLMCDAWLDPQRTEKVGGAKFLERLRAGERMDVSVGAFVSTREKVGEYNDKRFAAEWREIVPDHLAVLHASRGACDQDMGCGLNRAAESLEETMEPRSLKERLLALFTFKGAAASQADLKDSLEEALREVTPGFLCIDTVYLDDTVVYMVGSSMLGQGPDDMKLWKRSFTKSKDAQTITLADDATEVEAVTTYEPKDLAGKMTMPMAMDAVMKDMDMTSEEMDHVKSAIDGDSMKLTAKEKKAMQEVEGMMRSAAGARNSASDLAKIQTMHDHSVDLGATCSAQNIKTLEEEVDINNAAADVTAEQTTGASPVVEPRAAEAAASINAACGCTEGDKPMTQEQKTEVIKTLVECKHSGFTAGDAKMLESASDERLESFRVAAEARKKEVESARTAEAKLMSEEDFMKAAPPSLRSLIDRQQRQETEHKVELVTVLKAAQAEYTEAELSAMPVGQLERMARVANVEPKLDYSGRGLARTSVDENTFVPPDPYAAAIRVMQAKIN